MLAGDSESRIPRSLFDDRRVRSFWDPERAVGSWLGRDQGYVVWDAYYAFPRSVRWNAELPEPVATGSPIISATGSLESDFLPLLG